MGGNGLSVADGTADIDFSDGVNLYGFKLSLNSSLTETRGSAYAGQIASGGQTYQDAEPWKRKVYDNWLGGLGQISDNKVYGGTGIGGDDTKYFYADATTDRAGYLLPGTARNLVYNTISGQTTPITNGLDPNAGDEQEVPRGVLPAPSSTVYSQTFRCSSPTVTNIRLLVYFRSANYGNVTITGTVRGYNSFGIDLGAVTTATYSTTISMPTASNYTGWKWVTVPLSAGTGVINLSGAQAYSVKWAISDPTLVAIGCSAPGTCDTVSGFVGGQLLAYIQLMTSSTPSKWWSSNPVKFEQLLNGTTYVNVAITTGSIFNTAATGTAGTAGTSPERTFAAGNVYTGSIVFNNQLYVGQYNSGAATGATQMWNAAAAAGNSAATNSNTFTLGPATSWGGYIYYIDGAFKTSLYKWDGTFPGTATLIISAGSIGQSNTTMNNLFIYQGNLWVIKPEGLFQLYADPTIIDTQPGNTPRIIPVVTDLPSAHQDTGKWYCLHQGMIYFNYRNRIYQVLPGLSGPPQVTVLSLPIPWYRLSYYNYVNGITSDGVNLYVSFNNLGVFKYVNQTWHPVTEFYEQVGVESQSSGLRWLPNPAGGADSLFVGDGNSIVQLPVPNAASPYTSQIYRENQNKCGYLITSATDMDEAEIVKFIQSIVMRAVPSGFYYKIVPVAWQSATAPSFKNLLEQSFIEGLMRDNWVAPNTGFSTMTAQIVTTQIGAVTPSITAAPTCWVSTDFNNIFYSSEKLAATTTDNTTTPPTTDILTNPTRFAQTAFILYFWGTSTSQNATSTARALDPMAVDSFVVKYQAIQDYLASYQCVIDFHLTVSGTGSNTNTTQQIEDAYEWLRSQTGRHSPLKVTFRKRVTGDAAGKIKTVYFLPQNPGWISDPTLTALAGGDPGEPLIKTVSIQMVSTTSEYANV